MRQRCGRVLVVAASMLILMAAATTRALAISEACPAQIQRAGPIGTTVGTTASSYVYELDAISPRSVDATMIADTSGGWYMWNVAGVPLAKVVRHTSAGKYDDAASAPLGVQFPSPVLIRHAWVVHAKSSGERLMGWDSQGDYRCRLPAFSPKGVTEAAGNEPTRPTPPPLGPPTRFESAVATVAPFPVTSCAKPFALPNIVKVVRPSLPLDVERKVIAVVVVTVDDQGNVVDATMRATTGWDDADKNAIQAAVESVYKEGISYCRPVGGRYLFRVHYDPD